MSNYPVTENLHQTPPPLKRTSPSRLRIVFYFLLGGLALYALYLVADILQLLVISALLAYLLDPFANWLETNGMHRSMATFTIFLLVSILLFLFFVYLLPIAVEQISMLQAGAILEQFESTIEDVQTRLEAPLSQLGINDLDLLNSVKAYTTNFFRDSLAYIPDVLAMLSNMLVVPFMLFFFIKDGRSMKKGLISMVPNRYFEFSLNVTQKMDLQLGNYLRGQFLVAFIDGTLATIALWLLGVDFFLVIGPVAGLANMIPYIGPFIGLIPALISSLLTTGNFDTMPAIIITFLVIQLIDSTFLQPIIVAKNVELHPLVVLVAILIGGKLFGLAGLLLAVPFTAILKVIIQETITNMRRYHLS